MNNEQIPSSFMESLQQRTEAKILQRNIDVVLTQQECETAFKNYISDPSAERYVEFEAALNWYRSRIALMTDLSTVATVYAEHNPTKGEHGTE